MKRTLRNDKLEMNENISNVVRMIYYNRLIILLVLFCNIRNTNTFSIVRINNYYGISSSSLMPAIRYNNNHCKNNIRLDRVDIIRLHSKKKVDEEWIAFLKQQKENNGNNNNNRSNSDGNNTGSGLGIRDRMKKWLSFKKNKSEDSTETSTTTSSSYSSESPMVQPIQIHPQEEEEIMEEDGIDKMRSLRAEQKQQRQERIQENLESSWSLDAAVKDGELGGDQIITESKFLDNLLEGMPSMEKVLTNDDNKAPDNEDNDESGKEDLKNEYLKKQEMLRKMVTQNTAKEDNDESNNDNKSTEDDNRSSASIRAQLNEKAYDAVKQLRDKKKQFPLKQQSSSSDDDEFNPDLVSTWFEDPNETEQENVNDQTTTSMEGILSDDKDDNNIYDDPLYQTGDGRVLEIATKQVPISKQMYRSIASKQTDETSKNGSDNNPSDNMYKQYDSFLQKEEEMRQKMQAIRSNVDTMSPEELMKKKQQIKSDANMRSKQQQKQQQSSNGDRSMTAYLNQKRNYEEQLNNLKQLETEQQKQKQENESSKEYLHLDHEKDLHRDGDDYDHEKDIKPIDHMDDLEAWMKQRQHASFKSQDILDNYEDFDDYEDGDSDTTVIDQDVPNTPFFQEPIQQQPTEIDDNVDDDSSTITYSRISNNELEDMFHQPSNPNILTDNDASSYLHKGSSDDQKYYTSRKNDLLTNHLNGPAGMMAKEITIEEVNALMEYNYTTYRLLSINKPDSSYGAIFKLDGLIVDFTDLYYDIWLDVYNQTYCKDNDNNDDDDDNANYYDYTKPLRPPTKDEVYIAQTYPADEVVKNVFFWTNDYFEARDISNLFLDILDSYFHNDDDIDDKKKVKVNNNYSYPPPQTNSYSDDKNDEKPIKLLENVHVNEGIHEWLQELQNVDMPCSVISNLNYDQLDILLNHTNLSQYFPIDSRVVVTSSSSSSYYANNEIANVESQKMLNAAIRLNRRPDHCVVFDTTPTSAIAAHDVEMRHVAMMGLYPMYELNTADCIITDWDDLSVMNVRRLFSDKNYDDEREQPDLQLEVETPLVKPNARFRRWAEGDRD